MTRPSPTATYVGIALATLGFLLIALAWNGAASFDYAPAQFPYLISGGLTGIGLIVVGATVMVVQTMRREAAERSAELDRLLSHISELQSLLSPPGEHDPRTTGEYRPRPRPSSSPGDAATSEIAVGANPRSWQQRA